MPEDVVDRLRALAALPGVIEAAEAAREACTRLRFAEALRRRTAEAAAESRIRGAQASARLEGADLPPDLVRDLVRGAVGWRSEADPVERVVRGAVQATAETEHLVGVVQSAPLQALARLHVAAMGGQLPAGQVGRPRTDSEETRELVDLGPAPPATQVPDRLGGLVPLVAGASGVPAVVVAGLVHAEIATVRPFVRGNGVVARAMQRALVQALGLDPTGVAVVEVGHLGSGGAAYVGALQAYGTGTSEGVALWLRHCGEAVVTGVEEGMRVCAAVQVGRLG